MKSNQIVNINEALLVLKHFIELSSRLLPFLEELQRKENPTLEEVHNRNKIIDVYENYSFDTSTSKMLLNSDVLDLIKESFESLRAPRVSRSRHIKTRALRRFLKEHQRLQDNWFHINAN